MMQGYDVEAAVPFIAAAMRRAGHKLPSQELDAYIRRAIEADFAYMEACGVITEDGYMGEDEYVDDDAFEVLLDMLADDPEDEAAMDRLSQLLNSYMEAQQAFMEKSGLMDD